MRYDGAHHTLPLPDGPGKALVLTVRPLRDDLPIYLAAIGPKNLALAGEIADGILGTVMAYDDLGDELGAVRAGRERAGRTMDGFDFAVSFGVCIDDDLERAADQLRPEKAFVYRRNGQPYAKLLQPARGEAGYGQAAAEVQDLYLARKYDERPPRPCRWTCSTAPA